MRQARANANWVQSRKLLVRRLRRDVVAHTGIEPAAITKYAAAYRRALSKKATPSTQSDLLEQMCDKRVIFAADFHAFSQAQRTHLKILRALTRRSSVVLALEALPASHQNEIDLYMAGKMKEELFLKRIDWSQTWGFPWHFYRPLLEFARENNLRVVGLNPGPKVNSLSQVDRYVAKTISENLISSRHDTFYVLYGDLHVAPTRLPRELKKAMGLAGHPIAERDMMSVYLNSDRHYFNLAQRGVENSVEVLRLSYREYIVLSSPPWVVWQSYLMYLDRMVANDEEDLEIDPADEVRAFLGLLVSDLQVAGRGKQKNASLESFEVGVETEVSQQLWRKMSGALSAKELQVADLLVALNIGFYMPSLKRAFMPRSTVNHCAELAGQVLHAHLSKRRRFLAQGSIDFERMIWIEAIAFYMSKLINHKRASATLQDLRADLAAGISARLREPMLLALNKRLAELVHLRTGMRRKVPRPKSSSSYYVAARILGGMMGERIYLADRAQMLPRGDLLSWMKFPVEADGFAEFYYDVMAKLEQMAIPVRRRTERL